MPSVPLTLARDSRASESRAVNRPELLAPLGDDGELGLIGFGSADLRHYDAGIGKWFLNHLGQLATTALQRTQRSAA